MRRTPDNRLRTGFFHHLEMLPEVELTENGFAVLTATETVPEEMVEFSAANTCPSELAERACCHFYLEDYRFERVWSNSVDGLSSIRQFQCVAQPDFSLFTDMPEPIQKWNKYRSNLLAAWWSARGVDVIPNLVWSDEASYEWCFEGIPSGSVVCTSAVGCLRNKEAMELWEDGFRAAMEAVKPKKVLIVGKVPDIDYHGVEVIGYKNLRLERVRNGRTRK